MGASNHVSRPRRTYTVEHPSRLVCRLRSGACGFDVPGREEPIGIIGAHMRCTGCVQTSSSRGFAPPTSVVRADPHRSSSSGGLDPSKSIRLRTGD